LTLHFGQTPNSVVTCATEKLSLLAEHHRVHSCAASVQTITPGRWCRGWPVRVIISRSD